MAKVSTKSPVLVFKDRGDRKCLREFDIHSDNE
jgi:hypothetical protein